MFWELVFQVQILKVGVPDVGFKACAALGEAQGFEFPLVVGSICLYFPNHTRLFPISLSALPFFFTMLIPTLFQEVFPWSPSWLIIPSPILPGNPVHSTSQPLLYYIKMFPSENQYSKSSAVADFCFSLRDQIYVTSQKGHLWSSHTPTCFTPFFSFTYHFMVFPCLFKCLCIVCLSTRIWTLRAETFSALFIPVSPLPGKVLGI